MSDGLLFTISMFGFIAGVGGLAIADESSKIKSRAGNKLTAIGNTVAIIGWLMMGLPAFTVAQRMGLL